MGLHGRQALVQQLGGLQPGRPLHGRLGSRRELGLGRRLRGLCARTRGLRRGLRALHRVRVRSGSSGLGLRLGLGRWRRRHLRAGVFQHHGLKDRLFATVLALLLASL